MDTYIYTYIEYIYIYSIYIYSVYIYIYIYIYIYQKRLNKFLVLKRTALLNQRVALGFIGCFTKKDCFRKKKLNASIFQNILFV